MSEVLKRRIEILDKMFKSCKEDFLELKSIEIKDEIFDKRDTRILINSFILEFSKLQDMIGAKFFKEVLFELKEIEEHLPMIDILNRLEKLNILRDVYEWDMLRKIRNDITHEYFVDVSRVETFKKALKGYEILEEIYLNTKEYLRKKGLI